MGSGEGDLAALAAWAAEQAPERRPVAYFGEGLHGVFARRVGFEVRPRPRTWYTRLQDWYFRGLMTRWSRLGRRRLAIGHGEFHATEYWLSAARLQELHERFAAPMVDASRGSIRRVPHWIRRAPALQDRFSGPRHGERSRPG